jgi:predicted TIM-barrel fold metal-dependent hydrolase
MEFLDCNCYFGLPAKAAASPAACPTLDALAAQLDRAGIDRAVVWHIAQHDVSPLRGNELAAEAIRGRDRFLGCWTILPPQTGEMPVADLLVRMKASRVVALRAFPPAHRYLLNRETMGPLLEEMVQRRVPLLYSMNRLPPWYMARTAWHDLYGLMADFPEHGSWGCDRYFRPLLEQYERVYLDTSLYFLDGGIEDLVRWYSPRRLVFGSGLPERYPGGMMLAIRHAEIDDEAKEAIAGGNLAQILKEVRL